MAEAITAAVLPPIITIVQNGIHKIYDERTRHGLTKLNEVFLNAQMGDFTEAGKTSPDVDPPISISHILMLPQILSERNTTTLKSKLSPSSPKTK